MWSHAFRLCQASKSLALSYHSLHSIIRRPAKRIHRKAALKVQTIAFTWASFFIHGGELHVWNGQVHCNSISEDYLIVRFHYDMMTGESVLIWGLFQYVFLQNSIGCVSMEAMSPSHFNEPITNMTSFNCFSLTENGEVFYVSVFFQILPKTKFFELICHQLRANSKCRFCTMKGHFGRGSHL